MNDTKFKIDDVTRQVRDAYRLVYAYQKSVIQIIRAVKQRLHLENCCHWGGPSDRALSRSDSCPFGAQPCFADMLPLLYSHFFYTNNSHKDSLEVGDYCVLVSHFADSGFWSDKGIPSDIEIDLLANNKDYDQSEPTLHISLIAVTEVTGSWKWWQVEKSCREIAADETPFEDWCYVKEDEELETDRFILKDDGEYHSSKNALRLSTTGPKLSSAAVDARLLVKPIAKLSSEPEVSAFLAQIAQNLSKISEKFNK